MQIQLGYTWPVHANNCYTGLPGLSNGRLAIIARPKIAAAVATICPGDVIVALHQTNSSSEPAGNWYWADTRYAGVEYPVYTAVIPWAVGDPNVCMLCTKCMQDICFDCSRVVQVRTMHICTS
jgi:hypothetical protein